MMKDWWWIFSLIMILAACTGRQGVKKAPLPEQVVVEAFQGILDSADVTGVVLVYDPAEGKYYSNDFQRCGTGHLPASTFKIPNSIIALETGVVESDSTVLPWNGKKQRLPAWEQDLAFRDAFQVSCVPCYQEIARKIGVTRMRQYLSKLDYGSMVVDSAGIDVFWLQGDSKITPVQQVDFLDRLYHERLPVSGRTFRIMRRIMLIQGNDTFRLSGKTGWSIRNGNNNGWFVGYLETKGKVYFIATNIDPNTDFNMDMFAMIRKDISLNAFRVLGIDVTGH